MTRSHLRHTDEGAWRWFMPASIRGRTTLVASSVFAVAMMITGIVSVSILRSNLIDNVDTGLELRAGDLRSLVNAGVAPRTIAIADDGSTVARIQVRGLTVTSTSNVDILRDLDSEPFPLPDDGTIVDVEIGDSVLRVLRVDVASPAGAATITVGTTLDEVNNTVNTVAWGLVIGGLVLTALAAATTRQLVGRSLRQVDELRREVADITVGGLDRRVAEPASDDEIRQLAATMNDMLARLEVGTKAQQEFLAAASHELRTPIAVVQHRLSVAQRLPDVDWPIEAIGVSNELRRLQRLVDDLLYLARGTALDTDTVPSALVDLDDVVLDEVQLQRDHYTTINLDTRHVSAGQVRGSLDQLRAVIRNLIENAMRHAHATVEVSVTSVDGVVRLDVADDGPGINIADRQRVFDRFVRLESDPASGFGLGLAIVREVVERHGGAVRAEQSKTLGGARLCVEFADARTAPSPSAHEGVVRM
ncbi:MAG: HAMP domain-containing sensor histidine kinase [Ilumatobacter sp.]|uniref:sensor histidine kinase n=1 Tax=Ilumatobacter sp. TaxID=1967498 RepID=UPI003C728B87